MQIINERYDPAVPVNKIQPHRLNPRQGDIGAISQSIAHNGFYGAVIVQESSGDILAGSHRWRSAIGEGAETIPVIYVDVDDETAKRILVSDNRANDLAGYDNQCLAELLEQIRNEQGDFTGTLYDQEDYDRLLSDLANGYVSGLPRDEIRKQEFESPDATVKTAPAVKTGNCEDDETPEPGEQPVSQLGDLWICGDHRVLCGDSTEQAQVARLMDGQKADMVFTDPPYNVGYDPEARVSYFSPERLANKLGQIKNAKKSPEDFRAFLNAVYSSVDSAVKPGRAIYICHDRKQTTIVEVATHHYNKAESDTGGKYIHPTQKPVALIVIALVNSSNAGEVVLDLFGGSGSTMIACEKHARHARLMELDPKYCDVICKRYLAFSGQQPVLEGTGGTFDDVALERGNAPLA